MKDITYFMKQIQLPEEACRELSLRMEQLRTCKEEDSLDRIAHRFFSDKTREHYRSSLMEVRDLGIRCEIPEYTAAFLYLMTCAELLEEEYRQEQLPSQLFWDTMTDLRFKLQECYEVYGIWGTFVADWYYIFWNRQLFKLGRLEYETNELTPALREKWQISPENTSVLREIHIPSAGPLKPEEVLESLRLAYEFFGFQKPQIAEFYCESWLLCPFNHEIFAEASNLRTFFDLFTVFDFHADPEFSDCWRIYSLPWTRDPSLLPQKTRLQKSIVRHLSKGRHMGEGLGVLRFDGTSVLK